MASDYRLENPSMNLEDENNYKFKYIKSVADSFLLAQKENNDKINWSVDMEKLNAFLNPSDTLQEENGKSL